MASTFLAHFRCLFTQLANTQQLPSPLVVLSLYVCLCQAMRRASNFWTFNNKYPHSQQDRSAF